ncbi:hypothetical protein VL10_24120 [Leclercia adecarboxylata]|nr:hypothetical protein VL10_24120 [Leclercia adecarboxylata]KMN66760.1 hypothetical protein VK95_04560 [Leclercia sp. LK8]
MLTRSLRRLLVMGALAAANHRLDNHAMTIRDAFPQLIKDQQLREQCNEVMQALLDNSDLTSASYSPLTEVSRVLSRSNLRMGSNLN